MKNNSLQFLTFGEKMIYFTLKIFTRFNGIELLFNADDRRRILKADWFENRSIVGISKIKKSANVSAGVQRTQKKLQ